jgi:hypothetical protein
MIHYIPNQVTIYDPPDNQPRQVPVRELLLLAPMEEYDITRDGQKALDADALGEYFYYPDDHTGMPADLVPIKGLHFSADPGGFRIPPGFPDDSPITVTLITTGPIVIQSDTVLTPYVDRLLLFTTFGSQNCPSTETAIALAGSRFNWEGLIYAPFGDIDLSAADNSSLLGIFAGWTANISGSHLQIINNSCTVYLPSVRRE